MKLIGDFHTHTNYTHGEGSIEESVKQAENLGLQALAITDHAYKSAYAMKKGDLNKMREDIAKIKDKYRPKILLGIEANLISSNGDVDVPDTELNELDLVVLGFHRFTKVGFKEFVSWVLPNLLRKKPTKKQIEINTQAYINAVNKYKINVISHMNYLMKVDCGKVAAECAKVGTLIELNGKKIDFTDDDVKAMLATDVKFIVDSDAHSKGRVGDVSVGMDFALKHNIPLDRIVNIKKI